MKYKIDILSNLWYTDIIMIMNKVGLGISMRRRMGGGFQKPTLLKNLSILDNIILPQMRDHRRYVKRLRKKAVMLMNQMGIEELKDRGITQASGSQLQRAGICRALMGGPGIIFTDEPTGALNTKAAKEDHGAIYPDQSGRHCNFAGNT